VNVVDNTLNAVAPNYATQSITVQGRGVVQQTPTINWANPADIVYGTPLGGTQLNATATLNGNTVPGNFAFTPAAGTVLEVGSSQTLSVLFTPTDTTDYTTATASVQINVTAATLTVTATSTSANYGQATPPALLYGITGFVNNDTQAVVSGAPSESTVSTTSTPGVYAISISLGTLSAANYSFAFVPGSLKLNQAPSTTAVTAVAGSIYGNQTDVLTATVSITGVGVPPSGTVTFYNGATPIGLPVTCGRRQQHHGGVLRRYQLPDLDLVAGIDGDVVEQPGELRSGERGHPGHGADTYLLLHRPGDAVGGEHPDDGRLGAGLHRWRQQQLHG
jgi:hypothetical protein